MFDPPAASHSHRPASQMPGPERPAADRPVNQRPVSVVVPAFGPEPLLESCVKAILGSQGVSVEVAVVDNGADPAAIFAVRHLPGVTVLEPGHNTGFTGACNLGAEVTSAGSLVFVNSDVVVDADCIAALTAAVSAPDVGLACGSLRLAGDEATLNSAGNPVHFLYISWAGHLGEAASAHCEEGAVASISGATFAIRREVWQELGGFDEEFFAYCDDVDLSMRSWQRGYRVLFVPTAVSVHNYEFGRHPGKLALIERNRLINLLTLPEAVTLRWTLPMALLVEVGMLLMAIHSGWGKQKAGTWLWLWRNRDYLRARRRRIGAARLVADSELLGLLADRVEPSPGTGFRVPGLLNSVLAVYWRVVMRRVSRPSPVESVPEPSSSIAYPTTVGNTSAT